MTKQTNITRKEAIQIVLSHDPLPEYADSALGWATRIVDALGCWPTEVQKARM